MTSLRSMQATLLRKIDRRHVEERGAYAILMGMTLVLVIALAAIAVDIASQVDSKQRLKDTMDAAAHEAALALGSGVSAVEAAANSAAARNGHNGDLGFSYWCVVAATEDGRVNTLQIPTTCDPGKGTPYTTGKYPGLVCDDNLCFIPCFPELGGVCNTVRIEGDRDVDYNFAPAIGYDKGNTGDVVSVACKGSCGTEAPNAMDIVIMADRTTSMSDRNRETMKTAIADSLTVMDPKLQYVALGTLHKSEPRKVKRTDLTDCLTHESGVKQSRSWSGDLQWNGDGTPVLQTTNDKSAGDWVAVDFSNTYLTEKQGSLVESDDLVRSIRCMPGAAKGNYGTQLAASLKGAARYLLGKDPNNLHRLPVREDMVPKKVIIFETDGSPDEVFTNRYIGLNSPGDFGAGRNNPNGQEGCDNFARMAQEVKDQGVLLITIGFGDAGTARCRTGSRSTDLVRDVLAKAASPAPGGTASTASDCSDDGQRELENSDGDFFFCAAEGAELENIFRSALSALTGGVKFLRMPS